MFTSWCLLPSVYFRCLYLDLQCLKIERESCLLPIMDLIESFKEGNVPPSVAMALYNVIGLLWEDRKDTALLVLRSQ